MITAPSQDDADLFDRFIRTLLGVLTARGVDMAWAGQVHHAMTRAGLTGVHTVRYAESWTGGGYGCMLYGANAHQQADHLRQAGLTAGDLVRLHHLLQDRALSVTSYPFVSVRGQRPTDASLTDTAAPGAQR